jgi:very-short-patch-repair endonuclease
MHFDATAPRVVTRAELEAAGVHHRRRRALVEEGVLRHFALGVYLVGQPEAPRDRWLQLAAATLLANGPGAVLSRSAAAALWALDGFELPAPIDVNVPRSSFRRGARVHRVPSPAPVDKGGLPVTSIAQTLVEVGNGLVARDRFEGDPRPISPHDRVDLALESALRRGLALEAELAAATITRGTRRRGAAILRDCLERRPPGAAPTDSYLETRGIQLLRRAGLPTGQRQVRLSDERGAFVARVDLLLPGRLVVEFDGREHHARVADFDRDRARWDAIVAAGHRVLVFSNDHVERQPTFVVDTVLAAVQCRPAV